MDTHSNYVCIILIIYLSMHTKIIHGRHVENYLRTTYAGDVKYIGDDFFWNV